MPAKEGNLNRATNGSRLKGMIARLNLGELPGTLRGQLSTARKYRRDLELAVAATKGEVNLWDAHLIDECTKAECHASLCRYLLRDRWERMSENDIMTASREILKAVGVRNRAFAKLGLDQDQENTINALYCTEITPTLPATAPEGTPEGNGPA
jgi:hypothetical protein